jgi:signal transduction histidine kinase
VKKFDLINRNTIYTIIIFGLICLSGLNFWGWIFIQGMKKDFTERLKQQILHLGKISTKLIESYMMDLDEIYPGMETTPKVRIYQQLLFDIKTDNDLENIVILDLLGRLLIDSRLNFIIGDSLSTFPLNQEKFQAAVLGETPEPIFIELGNQYFMSSYVPIMNSFEEPLAVLVIDAPMGFFKTLREFELGALYFAFIGLGILKFFSLIIVIATQRLFRAESVIKEKARLAQLGQMAASVAHEIRNPLSIIKGTADVLQKKYTETNEELFNFIPEEINRLNRLVEDFLQFAKSRKLTLNKDDLGKIVIETVQPFHDTRLDVQIDRNLPQVKIDRDAIRQVLLNIIHNAIDAIQPKGKIQISVERLKKNPRFISIRIKDDGKGIPVQNLNKIFQPFFSTKASGSGLGLAISKQLVEQQNGKISILSSEGEGTTVEVLIPVTG